MEQGEEVSIPIYGRRLREMRERRQLNRAELGRLAETTGATVGRLERGQRINPALLLFVRFARILGCSLDYLAGLRDDPQCWAALIASVGPWDRSGPLPPHLQEGSLEGVYHGAE